MWKTRMNVTNTDRSTEIKLIKTQKDDILTSKNSTTEFFSSTFPTIGKNLAEKIQKDNCYVSPKGQRKI